MRKRRGRLLKGVSRRLKRMRQRSAERG